uniref:RNA1 polyprotein n=1 Tax=Black raspberry necrosis virus TaxID=367301 RepID=D8MIA6_9SECO|nr:viral polyprotein [Black raspberry necrosis virus]
MSYLTKDLAAFIESAIATGYSFDNACELYQRFKIVELNANPVSRAFCRTYKEWVDEQFTIPTPEDIDILTVDTVDPLTAAEPNHSEAEDVDTDSCDSCDSADGPSSPISVLRSPLEGFDVDIGEANKSLGIDVSAYPCLPKGKENCDLKNIMAGHLFSSPIFPISAIKHEILAEKDLNRLASLFDVVNTVTHSIGLEQEGFSLSSLTGAIKSRISGATGLAASMVDIVANLSSASSLLEKIFQRIITAFDYIASSIGTFGTFLTGIKEKIIEKCTALWEKLAEWGDHFYYIIPTFCAVFLVSITCFLINKFLAAVAPTYCFSMSVIVHLIVVCCALVGCKELGAALLSLTKAGKLNFLNMIYSTFGAEAGEANITVDDKQPSTFHGVDGVFEDVPLSEGASSMTGFFGVLGLLTFFTPKELKFDLYEMTKWAHGLKGLADGYEKFKVVAEKLAFWAYEKVGLAATWDAPAIQSMILVTGIRFQDWCKEVDLLAVEMQGSASLQEDLSRARKLKEQGLKIQDYMVRGDSSISFMMRERLKATMGVINDIVSKFEKAIDIGGTRMCPFTVLFFGAPGVGKSNTMGPFMHEIMDRNGESKIGRVYPRNSGDEHWSHYMRQTALVYDEFAQRTPTPGRSDELELIPLVSCNHYPLVGAAIADKGLSFNSKYIFMCSNRADVSAGAGLADPDAFRRRRHVCVEVFKNDNLPFRPDEPYYNQMFQLRNPLRPKDPLTYIDEAGHQQPYPRMTYGELCLYVAEKSAEHFDKEAQSLKFMRKVQGLQEQEEFVQEGPLTDFHGSLIISPKAISEISMPHFHNTDDNHQIHGCTNHKVFCCSLFGTKCDVEHTAAEISYVKMIQDDVHPHAYSTNLAISLAQSDRTLWDVKGFRKMVKRIKGYGIDDVPEPVDEQTRNFVRQAWREFSDRDRFLIYRYFEINDTLKQKALAKVATIKEEIKSWSVAGCWNAMPMGVKWMIGVIALFSFGCVLVDFLHTLMSMRSWSPVDILGNVLGASGAFGVLAFTSEGGSYAGSGVNIEATKYRDKRIKPYSQGGDGSGANFTYNELESIEAIKKGQYLLSYSNTCGLSGVAAVFMYKDHSFLISTHEADWINYNKTCYMVGRDGTSREVSLAASGVKKVTRDGFIEPVCSIDILPTTPVGKASSQSVWYNFHKTNEGRKVGVIVPNNRKDMAQECTKVHFRRNKEKTDCFNYPGSKGGWSAHDLLHAKAPHGNGMCGRLLLSHGPAGNLLVVGLHVSGGGLNEKATSIFGGIDGSYKDTEDGKFYQQGDLDVHMKEFIEPEFITEMVDKIGRVDPSQQFRPSQGTSIIKSEIHDDLWRRAETCPTVLTRSDPRPEVPFDPYQAGIRKFVKEVGPLDFQDEDSTENIVLVDIAEELLSKRREAGGFELDTVLDTHAAINGVDGMEYAEPLVMGTSEGYPYVLERQPGDVGKFRYFSKNLYHWELNEEPKKELDELEESVARDDFDGKIITIACAKDEKTKLVKVYEKPKTRIFEILPYHYNILVRKYYLFFMQFIMKMHNILPCKVGLNPFSQDWDEMHAEHTRFDHHFNGDYSGFDTGTPRQLLLKFADLISDLAGDGRRNKTIRRNLMQLAVDRRILVLAELFHVRGGTPSGFALTVIINSMVNQFYLMWAWRKIMQRISPTMVTYRIMKSHCTFSVYGDDNVVSFSLAVRDMYNLCTIADELKTIGVTLSDGKKTGVLIKWSKFDDLDFLKRRWELEPGHGFKCPLDKMAIEERLFWVRKSEDNMESLDDNCYSALMEAFHHGPEYFQDLRGKILDGYQSAGLEAPILLHYQEAKTIWFEQHKVGAESDFFAGVQNHLLPSIVGKDVVRTISTTIDWSSIRRYNEAFASGKYTRTKVFLDPLAKEIQWLKSKSGPHLSIPASLNKDTFQSIIEGINRVVPGEICVVDGRGDKSGLVVALALAMDRAEISQAQGHNMLLALVVTNKEVEYGLQLFNVLAATSRPAVSLEPKFTTSPTELVKGIVGVEVYKVATLVKQLPFGSVGPSLKGRMALFYSDGGFDYSHDKYHYTSQGWPAEIADLAERLGGFNSCLVQKYDKGAYIPFHSDDEPCYNLDESIVTVNLDGRATFIVRNKTTNKECRQELYHGSIIEMLPGCQKLCKHSVVVKDQGRVSLTFRRQRRTMKGAPL